MPDGGGGSRSGHHLSQTASALFVVVVLTRTGEMYRLSFSKIRLDKRMLARIIRIGLPAGLQSVMYSLSNVIIQSSVNSLGTDTIAAWTAYGKIDSVFWMIINAFGISITDLCGAELRRGENGPGQERDSGMHGYDVGFGCVFVLRAL